MKKTFQILGIVLCLVPMIGFGLCGIFGVTASTGAGPNAWGILLLGLLGIGISAAFGFVIYVLSKNLKSDS